MYIYLECVIENTEKLDFFFNFQLFLDLFITYEFLFIKRKQHVDGLFFDVDEFITCLHECCEFLFGENINCNN